MIKAHELGVVTTSIITNGIPSKFKCSERLAYIVSVLEKYALVRLDVLRSWHVDEIAADPEGFIKRKITNCWNNGQRAEKTASNKKGKEGEDGVKPSKKRKARGGDVQAEQDVVETAAVKGKKAKVATSGGGNGAAKKDGEDKGKGGAKRTKSAAKTGDHDDSELASHESPIGHKSSSVDGVKSSEKKEGESNAESEGGAKVDQSQETTPSADEKKPAHERSADHTPPSAGEVKSSSSTGSGDED